MLSIVKNIEGKKVEFLLYREYNVTPVAVAKLVKNENDVHINVINVARGYRSQGYGTMLLNQIIESYKNEIIHVSTFSHLIEWYQKNGFKIVGRKGNIYQIEKNINS